MTGQRPRDGLHPAAGAELRLLQRQVRRHPAEIGDLLDPE